MRIGMTVVTALVTVLIASTGWAQERDDHSRDRGDFRRGPSQLQDRDGDKPHHDRPGPRPSWRDKETHELIETLLMVRLAEKLDLEEEETVVMVRKFKEQRKARGEHREEKHELLDQLREAIDQNASDEVLQKRIDALIAHEREEEQMNREFVASVSEGLSTKQRAKLLVFLYEFDREMRRLIMEARRAQGPPDRPPHDGGHGPGGPPPGDRR